MYKASDKGISRELSEIELEGKMDLLKVSENRRAIIEELRSGVGEQMKKDPSSVEIIVKPKPTFKEKLINFFKRF